VKECAYSLRLDVQGKNLATGSSSLLAKLLGSQLCRELLASWEARRTLLPEIPSAKCRALRARPFHCARPRLRLGRRLGLGTMKRAATFVAALGVLADS
jgi:hypothetical protein